jgi:Domain of unknown function (DUF397)
VADQVEHARRNGGGRAAAGKGAGEPGQLEQTADLLRVTWRKSSWSSYNGNCVEVGILSDMLIGVRDSKSNGTGPVLTFPEAAWASFIAGVKKGDFSS